MNAENILSIDVEDWYQSSLDLFKDSKVEHGGKPAASVVKNTAKTLDLLDKTSNKATFFILGTVARYYPELVKEIVLRGHEVATHGYSHQLVYNMKPQDFEDDLKLSLDHLAKAGCVRISGYRAPYWSITKRSLWALDILKKLGMTYDSSIFPIRRGLYGIADAPRFPYRLENGLWEFPPATVRCLGINIPIAGGGYLRMVPYNIISSAIKRTAGDTVRIFYFHPYELDPDDTKLQHKVKSAGSIAYWIQQCVGRGSNPRKLENLLTDFRFTSFELYMARRAREERP